MRSRQQRAAWVVDAVQMLGAKRASEIILS